jgi:CubicO group peptidase (beta-lactamase class C family)
MTRHRNLLGSSVLMRRIRRALLLLCASLCLFAASGACGPSPVSGQDDRAPQLGLDPPGDIRDQMTVRDLLDGQVPGVVHNAYFMAIGESEPPTDRISGTLHFSETPMATPLPDSTWEGTGQTVFPEFSVSLISHGQHLIPLERGILLSGVGGASFWNIIVGPGRVWRERADGGYSRAAFPFTLTSNGVGQARNGVATFVYNSSTISNVAIQITQETAPFDTYLRADFYAVIPATYEPAELDGESDYIAAFERELATRLPVRPWTELSESELARRQYHEGALESDVSAAALLIDGVLYVQELETRAAGPYPFPDDMRHGVFSVTKTLGMGLAMFYIAQRFSPDVFEALITDYVPILADHPGWQGVTFAHTLGMATGNVGGEKGINIHYFIVARTAESKLYAIRDLPDAPPAPGKIFNYASTHVFVLSYALNEYVKARHGPDADYWLMLREDVLRPLGIETLPLSRTIEAEGKLGTPIMAWGSYPTVNEAAKIAQLLQDEGRLGGEQLLSAIKVREALSEAWHPGYDTGGNQSYYHSVWRRPANLSRCVVHVPTMSGHGGNLVMMLPNGLTAIRFGDDNHYDITPMVRATERYRSSCR